MKTAASESVDDDERLVMDLDGLDSEMWCPQMILVPVDEGGQKGQPRNV